MEFHEEVCRICLQDGAKYTIFEKNECFELDMKSKIFTCLHVDIQDVDGYPRRICKECNETLNIICKFINKFKETCKKLENKLLDLKKENDVYSENESINEIKADDIKNESNYECDESETKINVNLCNVKKEPKKEKEKLKIKTCSKISTKNNTNKIASSILEGEFSWSGEEWCLKLGKAITPVKKPVKIAKPKMAPPPKLCDLCGEVFKDQDKLSVHKKKIHFKNPVKCPKCPRFCVSDYYLKRHIKRKHEKEKNFVCTTCNRGFAFRGELTNHYKNVHNKALKPKKVFACKLCDKTYKCHKSVIVHERSVHTGARPAICSVCGSSFFHIDYLKEHMRLHTGETPFKCPICGKGYAQRCNMKSHLRIHRISELDETTLNKLRPSYVKLLKA